MSAGNACSFPGSGISYSYFDQPDWPAPPPGDATGTELIYLELTEQEVSAVEDPDLLEVALGGPDTTQRVKLLRRVCRQPVKATDCASAWDIAVADWAKQGWLFDPATMRLLPEVALQVGFTEAAGSTDPCDPVATGGYLGTENQMIRVRIAGSANDPRLIWGYDNASFLYRAIRVSGDPTRLTLAADPPDGFHVPQTGQLVEVLSTAAVLGIEPDETDPTGQAQILQVAAEADGTLRRLAQPYGASQGDPTSYIVLESALPASLLEGTLPLFLRVWQASLPLPPGGGTVDLTDPSTGNSTGLAVTLSTAATLPVHGGAFWQLAVRPATPQGVYPEDFLTAPQPPDGPRRWACPLAVIDWQTGTVSDCRNSFDNLVTLSRRKPGCCTVAIGPADVTAATPLQMLLDRAAAQAETVTVCLSPGSYVLPASLLLTWRHVGMTLECCGGRALLKADPNAGPSLFADGLLVLWFASGVTLRGLTLSPPQVDAPEAARAALVAGMEAATGDSDASIVLSLERFLGNLSTSFGIRVFDSPSLTLDTCTIEIRAVEEDATADLFAAALFLQGDCAGLTLRDCTLGSTIKPTLTPITIPRLEAAPAAADTTVNRALVQLKSSLAGAPATSPPQPAAEAPVLTQAKAAFDVVATNRVANPFVFKPDPVIQKHRPPVIITIGVLGGESWLGDVGTLPCALGEAAIRTTRFTGLTFATWLSPTAKTLRLQDNTVTRGVAGFWLGLPGATVPPRPAADTSQMFESTILFEEFLLAMTLGFIFPLPSASAVASRRLADSGRLIGTEQVIKATASPPQPITLLVMGNEIDLPGNATEDNPQPTVSAGLMLSLYQDSKQSEKSLSASPHPVAVILSANRVTCGAGLDTPAVLLLLPNGQPCAITGNIITNTTVERLGAEPELVRAAPSLWLIVANSGEVADLLTVTGNVLVGASDLSSFRRNLAENRTGWSRYNAEPN